MTSSHLFGVLGQCSTLYLSEDSVRASPLVRCGEVKEGQLFVPLNKCFFCECAHRLCFSTLVCLCEGVRVCVPREGSFPQTSLSFKT